MQPQPLQRRPQLRKHAGGARQQQHKAGHRRQPALRRRLGAGQAARTTSAPRSPITPCTWPIRLLQIGLVHPPAQQADDEQQQRRQAEHAVERHGGAHAQAVSIQPQAHGAQQRCRVLHQGAGRRWWLGEASGMARLRACSGWRAPALHSRLTAHRLRHKHANAFAPWSACPRSGKSTVTTAARPAPGPAFIDMDHLLEQRLGLRASGFF